MMIMSVGKSQRKRNSFANPKSWTKQQAQIQRMKGKAYLGTRRVDKKNAKFIARDVTKEARKMRTTCKSSACAISVGKGNSYINFPKAYPNFQVIIPEKIPGNYTSKLTLKIILSCMMYTNSLVKRTMWSLSVGSLLTGPGKLRI